MESHHLKKTLGPLQVWALAVGLVISGEYFGWSYGWSVSGTFGFLIATLSVALFFTAFIFSLTELSTSIPEAGGPYAYAQRALGKHWAHFTAMLTLIEFIFAPPAIAFALGGYLHVLVPSVSALHLALGMMVLFGSLNFLSLHFSARFELVVTILAVVELLIFMGVLLPHFKWSHFSANGWDHGTTGIFASIPFAIWFFLGIEGVAMASEEVKNPKRDLPIGYISGILTLVFLAVGVMLAAGGAGNWRELSDIDYPIPKAVGMALGEGHPWVKAFAGIGLFGLVASLNGIIIGASRQLFAVSRAHILPYRWSRVNRFGSPSICVAITTAVGIVAILSGKTGELITLAGIGACAMYFMCMVSLFALRRKEPQMARPFKVPLYPFFPALALVFSLVCFGAMALTNLKIFSIFLILLFSGQGLMELTRKKSV
jgi:ethanolamine permease